MHRSIQPINAAARGQWFTGGCWALAAALQKRLPAGTFIGVKHPDGFAHVGLQVAEGIIDCFGVQTPEAFRSKWASMAERGGTSMVLEAMTYEQVASNFNQCVGFDYVFEADGTPKAICPSLVGPRADAAVEEMLS